MPAFRKSLLAIALLAIPVTASATGSVGCMINDANLDFAFEALFPYTGNAPLMQVHGSWESKNGKTAGTLRKFDFDNAALKQQWFENDDLKLQFYVETTGDGVPYASVKLNIEAAKLTGDEFEYTGKYLFVIEPEVPGGTERVPIKLTGSVSCTAG